MRFTLFLLFVAFGCTLSEALREKWVALANQLGIAVEGLDKAQSRRDFIQMAYLASLEKNHQ